MEEVPEKIKKIADTLLKSGLALTESEAMAKAREMLRVEEKFKKSISEKGVKVPPGKIVPGFDEDKTVNELIEEEDKEEDNS